MRKVISIACSVVLCMSIVLASVGQVSALENADAANREEQISALFDEMTESLALSLLNEAIAANIHGAAVVNSTPKTYSDSKTATVVAENYNAILPAIASYLNESGCYGCIYSFDIRCCDGTYTKTVYVPTPMSGPGQSV